MRTCTNCKKEKMISEFIFKNKRKGIRHWICRECRRSKRKAQYLGHKKATRERNRRNRLRNMINVYSYLKNHPCIDCGETDPCTLDFDHKCSKTKTGSIANMSRNTFSWKTIMKEISKCEVRCVNCHRKKTAKERNWYFEIKRSAPILFEL